MSQGDLDDKIIIQVALSQFLDENHARLPVSEYKIKDLPRQVSSADEEKILS